MPPPLSSTSTSKPHSSTSSRAATATATASSKALSGVEPTNHLLFDPWNSASTGHQRADGPTVAGTRWWRDVRTEKLRGQFGSERHDRDRGDEDGRDGDRGGEWRWMAAEEVKRRRERGCGDIRCFMGGVAKKRRVEVDSVHGKGKGNYCVPVPGLGKGKEEEKDEAKVKDDADTNSNTKKTIPSTAATVIDDDPGAFSLSTLTSTRNTDPPPPPPPTQTSKDEKENQTPNKKETGKENPPRGIFSGLTIYINGSTYPLISDHRLKHLLVSNGAEIAITLGRRKVTHVILGKHNGINGIGSGCGGGLSALKLQREIERVGGCGIRFVGVEWVLESLKASKRLPESRFADKTLHMASRRQPSVLGMFSDLNRKKRKVDEKE
ncbi:hypothetical protein VTN00DRAFT_2532 [Thermoascus crustaceus]|uniref:uncharacterized protein n=1 Tax=Thermoascus crustaceus TaxID=5088 RepID=UPI003744900B